MKIELTALAGALLFYTADGMNTSNRSLSMDALKLKAALVSPTKEVPDDELEIEKKKNRKLQELVEMLNANLNYRDKQMAKSREEFHTVQKVLAVHEAKEEKLRRQVEEQKRYSTELNNEIDRLNVVVYNCDECIKLLRAQIEQLNKQHNAEIAQLNERINTLLRILAFRDDEIRKLNEKIEKRHGDLFKNNYPNSYLDIL